MWPVAATPGWTALADQGTDPFIDAQSPSRPLTLVALPVTMEILRGTHSAPIERKLERKTSVSHIGVSALL